MSAPGPGAAMLLQYLSLAAALLFLVTRHRGPYKGRPLIKALACGALALAALPAQPLLAFALALSAMGDWFLALRDDKYFLHGLFAFLLAHLAYATLFALAWAPIPAAWWGVAGVVAVGAALAVWFFPDLGRMRLPVLVYTAVIATMAATAWLSSYPSRWLVPGTLMFMASDAFIAVHRFKGEFAFSHEVTWAAYYVGQGLIFFAVTGSLFHFATG